MSNQAVFDSIPEVLPVPMELMQKRFRVLRRLGKGSFGDAFLVYDEKHRLERVVKRLHTSASKMSPALLQESRAEIANLSRLEHPHIVRFYKAWFDVDNHLHILMEVCDSGDLDDFVKRHFPLPEPLVRSFFAQLIVGLHEIHHQHFMHRDIKMKNIFLKRVRIGDPYHKGAIKLYARSEIEKHAAPEVVRYLVPDTEGCAYIVKIGDFGLSKALHGTEDHARTVAGTPFHFSPELSKNLPYTRRSDIWALGIGFFFMLTCTMPFQGKTIPEVLRAIANERMPRPSTRFREVHHTEFPYSDAMADLVVLMLNKNEHMRPATEELIQHALFTGEPPHYHPPQQQQGRQQQQPDALSARAAEMRGQQQQQQQEETYRMVAARENAVVNIRREPSLRAEVIGELLCGDVIEVVCGLESFGHRWYRILSPARGYCTATHLGKELFVRAPATTTAAAAAMVGAHATPPPCLSPLPQQSGTTTSGTGTTGTEATNTTNTNTTAGASFEPPAHRHRPRGGNHLHSNSSSSSSSDDGNFVIMAPKAKALPHPQPTARKVTTGAGAGAAGGGGNTPPKRGSPILRPTTANAAAAGGRPSSPLHHHQHHPPQRAAAPTSPVRRVTPTRPSTGGTPPLHHYQQQQHQQNPAAPLPPSSRPKKTTSPLHGNGNGGGSSPIRHAVPPSHGGDGGRPTSPLPPREIPRHFGGGSGYVAGPSGARRVSPIHAAPASGHVSPLRHRKSPAVGPSGQRPTLQERLAGALTPTRLRKGG